MFQTVVEAVAYWAEKTPDKTCLIEAETGRGCTYAELWRWSRAFSMRLKELGLKKGENVTVRVGGLFDTYAAQFGIYLAGGVYCPQEQHMKGPRMIEMLDYLDSRVLVSTERIDSDCLWVDLGTVCDESDIDLETPEFPNPGDLCLIIFSTGTTGKAKGNMRSFSTNYQLAETYGNLCTFTADDIFMWVQALDRPTSFNPVNAVFIAGATAVHQAGIVFIKDFVDHLNEFSVSAMHLQSFAITILLGVSSDLFVQCTDQLRILVTSGGALLEEHKKILVNLLPKTALIVIYTATECSFISAYKFNDLLGKPNCAGKSLPNKKVFIVDDDGNEIRHSSKNNLGIIAVESPLQMLEYWKDPKLTAKTLRNGRVMMTDMGYIDDEGYLYIMGRRDDVIVTGGYKVAPYEIEEIAIQYSGVWECVCVAYPDRIMTNIPKLFVKMKDGAEFSATELLKFMSERLETFKVPRIVREIDDFPKVGSSQKIDRKALRNYD